MDLENTVAIVTGAGRGIGRAISRALAAEGAKVALVSRSEDQLQQTAGLIRESGGICETHAADVTSLDSMRSVVEKVRQDWGSLDNIINNAGSFCGIGPVWEVEPSKWIQDVNTNLIGVFNCVRASVEVMMLQGRGRIVNLIGGGTAFPFPHGTGYASSKAAVMRFTESIAKELKPKGIVTLALSPGLVKTTMTRHQAESDEGKQWLPKIEELFEDNIDLPPERAAQLSVKMAKGEFDRFTGHGIEARHDWDEILANADRIIDNELLTLRMTGQEFLEGWQERLLERS